tara:strand:+ start:7349 stop:7999 length:651 start_codon:yes stop_codon:yes gene_type:complete
MENNIEKSLIIISEYYSIPLYELKTILESNTNTNTNSNSNSNSNSINSNNIILPYYGIINESNCKGIVYNHGLYTQCTEKHNNLCSKCVTNKYGNIRDRNKFELGKYITPNGKKEVDYNNIINRFNYNISDVLNKFKQENIDITKFNIKQENNCIKKPRGRPKKIQNNESNEEVLEVIKYEYKDQIFLKTKENILLDHKTYDIVGQININKEVEIW